MKLNFVKVAAIGAVCLFASILSFAQSNKKVSTVRDTYVISAKAGAVNFVSGNISVVRIDGSRALLQKGEALEAGDKVLTKDGKAEILLNPGSFVRLAENTEFEFVNTSLDDLAVKLNRGSAIFEIITTKEFQIEVSSKDSRFYMLKSGIYRVDVNAEGTAKVEVWKGKAQIEDANDTTLKGGQRVAVGSVQAVVEKFDRGEKDDFELWSKDRAKQLAKINAKLREHEMNRALFSSFSNNPWNSYNGFGLWVRDPFSQSYCFLPFGYGWSSPYGYNFNSDIWQYRLPNQVFNQINQNSTAPNGQQSMPPSNNVNQPNIGISNPINPPMGNPRNSDSPRPVISPPGRMENKGTERIID